MPTATEAKSPPTSFLGQVKKGKIITPHIFMVYGPEGEGKTKLVSEAPRPILLEGEDGSNELDVERLPKPETWADVKAMMAELINSPHDYKTLGIDTMDWLEPILWRHICKEYGVKTIEQVEKGFGKGFGIAVDYWRDDLYAPLLELRKKRGVSTFLLAHHKAKDFNDPAATSAYARYNVGLQDGPTYSAAKFWREAVDGLFFLNRDVMVAGKDKGARGIDNGTRFLFTERRPGWDAKNRLGLPEKIMLPLGGSYKALMDAIEAANSDDPDVLIRQIKGLVEHLAVPEQRETVAKRLVEYGKDSTQLKVRRGKIEMILGAA
jgi:hypothetical protein